MNKIAGLELPHAEIDHPLHRILSAALPKEAPNVAHSIYWDASFFDLDRVKLFQDSPLSEQTAILQLANQSLLEEAYLIEKAGVGYMAKMVLLAETLEERMLYGLFTADETLHLSQISPFLTAPDPSSNPFLQLLAEVVEQADKAVLLFVIQVVLEGWGLSHYRRLAKGCRDRALADLFSSFLQAESRHHATGSTLFEQTQFDAVSETVEVLTQFLNVVRVGPQGVLMAIGQVKGHLSRSQKLQILDELDAQTHSGTRLETLRSLMRGESAAPIVNLLEERGLFSPLPNYQCICN
jgi:hypothetical protein